MVAVVDTNMHDARKKDIGGARFGPRKPITLFMQMDPVLVAIIRKMAQECGGGTESDEHVKVGEFTNRIIQSKKDNVRYYLRTVYSRLNGEFDLEVGNCHCCSRVCRKLHCMLPIKKH
jgi:hypothetical protein